LVCLLVFARLHAAAGKDVAAATANALSLQSLERALHLDVELGANRWLAGRPALGQAAMYVYRLYYAAIVGVLVWVYVRHPGVYRHVRRTAVAMLVLILPVYWLVPTAPPRFALEGIVDVVARFDILGDASTDTGDGRNHYSAMPSLHVGWSLWCAYAAWSALRRTRPRLAPLPWAFPALMAAVVLGTGNHYVLDIAGSVVLVAAAAGLARLSGMARREDPADSRAVPPAG
jgi:hypothetical protein